MPFVPIVLQFSTQATLRRGHDLGTLLRVLIVEDSAEDTELMLQELRKGGYTPSFKRVETVAELEAALDDELWDIVISNYVLPNLDGLEALRITQATRPGLPFIVVSGRIGEDIAVAAMRAGAQDYLVKGNLARLPAAVKRGLSDAYSRIESSRSQRELRLLRAAVAHVNDIIMITEAEPVSEPGPRILFVNNAFERRTGYLRSEVLDKSPRLLQGPKTSRAALDNIAQALASGEPVREELINYTKSGEEFWLELDLVPLTEDDAKLTHWVGIGRDITRRKEIELQLLHSQKMEAVGKLAGGVAHDFNDLLTAVTGYSELLLSQLDSRNPMRGDLEQIRNASERAAALTRQLLVFSRKQILSAEVLDLNSIIERMQGMLKRLIGEDIELETALSPSLANVKADAGQIEQVILNLATNARDAMPNGGKLIIETVDVELGETCARGYMPVVPGAYVMMAVTDTGNGMSPEVLARIFEPFFTTKAPGNRSGLGLSMVYGIVKQSGGNVAVYSNPGSGSIFKIYLPKVVGSPCRTLESTRQTSFQAGSEMVLLVEEEEVVRRLVFEILRRNGYTVLTAASGEEARRACSQHVGPIHLVLTDLVMSRMSGKELVKELMANRPEMKVLFFSGYSEEAMVRNDPIDSEAAFLQKPFTPGVLERTVRQILTRTSSDSSK
jgi:two-component system cell cycle sensor histidine kinase/response regulator CckA